MLATRFSVRNHAELRGLFGLLEAPFSETDQAANAETAKRLWLSEQRSTVAEYSDELLLRVLPFGSRMGMLGESLPSAGTMVRRMHNPGGTIRAMIKRFRLYQRLEAAGEQLGLFICWAGQRLRDPKMGETLEELFDFVRRENPAVFNDQWFKDELLKPADDPYQRPFATETEIMILCAKVVFGSELSLVYIARANEPSTIAGVPGRRVLFYQYSRLDCPGSPHIVILNGAAVERTNGKGEAMEPRPTSESTAKEIAKLFGFSGTEGLMVSNPHAERMALEIDHTVRSLGLDPTFVIYGLPGPEAADNAAKVRQAKTILGEAARILINEQRFAMAAS